MSDVVDELPASIAHYGVKGMRWGVVRERISPTMSEDVAVKQRLGRKVKTTGGRGYGPSQDAVRVAKIRQQAKKSTTDSLSNKELQEMIIRMNLERQYNSLKPDPKAIAVIKTLLGAGKSMDSAYRYSQNSPIVGALKKGLTGGVL